MHDVTNPFNGNEFGVCSYTAEFVSSHADGAVAAGMSEADYQKHLVKGQWGVYKAQIESGGFPVGRVLFRGKDLNGKDLTATYSGIPGDEINVYMHGLDINVIASMKQFEEFHIPKFDWNPPSAPSPAVSSTSKSVGALTDEDAATLFVKTKDDFAKQKGINIKGANPELDKEVYEAVAQQTGYTASELALKVEHYKTSGKKLSALKKKVLKDPDAVDKILKKKVASHPDPPKVAQSTPDGPGKPEPTVDVKVKTPEPEYVAPTKTAENDAVDYLNKNATVYADEDVAKAFIKAKDAVVADNNAGWTLYTKSDAFDQAIYDKMKEYGVSLEGSAVKKHVSDYIGAGHKLSVLKKKLIKSGEMDKKAATLKKTKAEKQFDAPPVATKQEAQEQIEDMASSAAEPVGSTSITLSEGQADYVFTSLKYSISAQAEPYFVLSKFETVAKELKKLYKLDEDISPLDVIRAYDKKKAAQLGIENGFFYEKKVTEWLASPAGKQYYLDKQAKEAALKAAEKAKQEFLDNLPPLPDDSKAYDFVSLGEASSRQRATANTDPWNAAEKSGLRTYTGGSYSPMNSWLRGRTSYINPELLRAVRNAQAGMRPVKEKWLVSRGCDYSQFGIGSEENLYGLVGKTLTDKGFLSTSAGSRAAFSGRLNIIIEVPEGTYGAYVQPISMHKNENEFLIAAGTDYKVIQVIPPDGPYGRATVRLRAIPGSHYKGDFPSGGGFHG